jgi:UDPglucose 6-dehydrogenase
MNDQLFSMHFPRLDLEQNRIQAGNQPRYPMFNSTELQILNKQNDITHTDMKGSGLKKDIKKLFLSSSEAEAIKLFSNSYLAMRVAFFKEIDTFCIAKNLNPKEIINGVSLDPRIGDFYNNPSFGYGGYCLPKDTKQLLSNFDCIPSTLIKSVIDSNVIRKKFIADDIELLQPTVVGIYRLTMKSGSDNFRESAVQDIMESLATNKIEIIIYEPEVKEAFFKTHPVIKSIAKFKSKADLILANRVDSELSDVLNKIYTRDIYTRD